MQRRFRDHDASWHRPAPEPGDLARRANRAARKKIDAAVLRSRYRDELDPRDASGDDVVPW